MKLFCDVQAGNIISQGPHLTWYLLTMVSHKNVFTKPQKCIRGESYWLTLNNFHQPDDFSCKICKVDLQCKRVLIHVTCFQKKKLLLILISLIKTNQLCHSEMQTKILQLFNIFNANVLNMVWST